MKGVSYRVFARKYRPQTFKEVIGQEHITRTLQNAIRQDRVAQAYLLVGPRGIGKTSTARIICKALNCKSDPADKPNPEPCGQCSACKEIAEGNCIDVIEIDGASNNGVDNIRDLREAAQYMPSQCRYKIYLVDEVHMLSAGAFNALLKILEEPPSHVKFLFATTESQKVPATITSRCQRFDLRRIPDDLIAKHLQFIAEKEGIDLEMEAAEAIAKGADGGLRDAESMFDQAISFCGNKITADEVLEVFGFTSQEALLRLTGHILRCELAESLQVIEEQDQAGKDLVRLVDRLISFLHDLLIEQATVGTEGNDLLGLVSREKMLELIEHFAECEGRLRWASDKRMVVYIGMIKAAHLLEQASLSDVIETIASLRDGQPVESRMVVQRETRTKPAEAAIERPKVATTAKAPAPTTKNDVAKNEEKIEKQEENSSVAEKPVAQSIKEEKPKEVVVAKVTPVMQEEEGTKNFSEAAVEVAKSAEGEKKEELREGEAKWLKVVRELVKENLLDFGWLGDGVFQIEKDGKLIVEFPEESRSDGEGAYWQGIQKGLDLRLKEEFGHPVKFHPEFTKALVWHQEEEVPAFEPPEEKQAEKNTAKPQKTKETKGEKQSEASNSPSPQEELIEKFKDDPLVRAALKIFEGEIITTQ